MEKIQIQFKESDYKVYYDYCDSYYKIHDAARKRSIHTFLDLYGKGIIPVEEQDIRKARAVLSQKCKELKSESQNASNEYSATQDLRVQACTDILLFCDDLEKMYRLYQKQGLVANYLVILGTFSKVIEAAGNLSAAAIYNLDPAMIESLAGPLAGIIQGRLGIERQWRPVLHELCGIAIRYNRISPGPKFDLDILRLIAPSVVSRFTRTVDSRELLPALQSEFDDCELEEFEALLNRTPDSLQTELNADVSPETLREPLAALAAVVEQQREQWAREHADISGPHMLSPGLEMSPATTVQPPVPAGPSPASQKVFDIGVSRDGTTHVDSPIKMSPALEPEPVKPGMAPHIPIIIGVGVILVFIVVAVILSGAWNPLDMGNSTHAVNTSKNITPAAIVNGTKVTPKATATPVKNATVKTNTTAAVTTKPVVTVTTTAAPKVYSAAEIGAHLVEIAFGPDNNVIVKPKKELLSLSATGDLNDKDLALLNDFIIHFNSQSTTTKIATSIDENSGGDISLVFMPEKSLSQIEVGLRTNENMDLETNTYRYIRTADGKTYVNSDMNGISRNKWILRAALMNLGLYGESSKYTDSLFYGGSDSAMKLSEIDLKALQLMYGKKVTNGMTKATVKGLY